MRYYEKGCISIALLFARGAVHRTRARWRGKCKRGDGSDGQSAILPPTLRFVLLVPRMLLCIASGPLALWPTAPHPITQKDALSSTCERWLTRSERGRGVSTLSDLVGTNSSKAIPSFRSLYHGIGPLSMPAVARLAKAPQPPHGISTDRGGRLIIGFTHGRCRD
jgi:hypothetical protein